MSIEDDYLEVVAANKKLSQRLEALMYESHAFVSGTMKAIVQLLKGEQVKAFQTFEGLTQWSIDVDSAIKINALENLLDVPPHMFQITLKGLRNKNEFTSIEAATIKTFIEKLGDSAQATHEDYVLLCREHGLPDPSAEREDAAKIFRRQLMASIARQDRDLIVIKKDQKTTNNTHH